MSAFEPKDSISPVRKTKTTLLKICLREVTIFVPSHYQASLRLSRIRKQVNQVMDKSLMA
jgi:hypothetical protein